jgi:hypothetical protein
MWENNATVWSNLQWQMFHKISQIIKAYDKQAQTG